MPFFGFIEFCYGKDSHYKCVALLAKCESVKDLINKCIENAFIHKQKAYL